MKLYPIECPSSMVAIRGSILYRLIDKNTSHANVCSLITFSFKPTRLKIPHVIIVIKHPKKLFMDGHISISRIMQVIMIIFPYLLIFSISIK